MTELKNEEKETPTEVAQPEKNAESEIDLQVQVVELESTLSKTLEEKENYKKGVLSKEEEIKKLKAANKALIDSPSEDSPEEKTEIIPPVEKPEEKEQEEKPKVEDVPAGYSPEKEAQAQFKKDDPRVNMESVLAEYRGGKYETVTEYLTALYDAKNYSDFKSGNKNNSENYTAQGSGVSEVENTSHQKVTAYDIAQAKKYFDGSIERYLKNKTK